MCYFEIGNSYVRHVMDHRTNLSMRFLVMLNVECLSFVSKLIDDLILENSYGHWKMYL